MKINKQNLDIALAKACMNLSDLRSPGQVSSVTLSKIRNEDGYDVNTRIVGKIALALNVDVEYLVEF